MTVKIRGNTIHVFTRSEDWQQAADLAAHSRPYKRHFYAAADPDSINPEYTSLLDEAEAIDYECDALTLEEAKALEREETFDFVTNDDEFDFADQPNATAFYHHRWTFHDGFPN